ncbi:hypothetical protein HN865_01215 [Candidatus Woesearchaeota archaeon]|jgi:hypothetical protein|nr:hypothetical protein [Candidatus Woesearchaeota archaeon]MBT7237456.1 hypothetical protein [Candidatus Woesearchaeota archaeon]
MASVEEIIKLDEAINFGIMVGLIGETFSKPLLVMRIPDYPLVKDILSNMNAYRNYTQTIVSLVDTKYSGIQIAEKAKELVIEKMEELEKLARDYNK